MAVVVDTSQWVHYFRIGASAEAAEVDRLLALGEVVMVGVVYAELLCGARDETQFRALDEQLDALPFFEMTNSIWRDTGADSERSPATRVDDSSTRCRHRRAGP